MNVQNLLANWKTSMAGIGMIVGALTHLGFAIYLRTLTETMVISEIMAAVTGWGLLMAGDASKSAKDVKDVDTKVDQTVVAVATGKAEFLPMPTAPVLVVAEPTEPPKV